MYSHSASSTLDHLALHHRSICNTRRSCSRTTADHGSLPSPDTCSEFVTEPTLPPETWRSLLYLSAVLAVVRANEGHSHRPATVGPVGGHCRPAPERRLTDPRWPDLPAVIAVRLSLLRISTERPGPELVSECPPAAPCGHRSTGRPVNLSVSARGCLTSLPRCWPQRPSFRHAATSWRIPSRGGVETAPGRPRLSPSHAEDLSSPDAQRWPSLTAYETRPRDQHSNTCCVRLSCDP